MHCECYGDCSTDPIAISKNLNRFIPIASVDSVLGENTICEATNESCLGSKCNRQTLVVADLRLSDTKQALVGLLKELLLVGLIHGGWFWS